MLYVHIIYSIVDLIIQKRTISMIIYENDDHPHTHSHTHLLTFKHWP